MIGRNDLCFCGSGKKWKKCHFPKTPPVSHEDTLATEYYKKYKIILKNDEQIKGIKAACKVTASILKKICVHAQAGVTTNELNAYAEWLHKEAGVIAAPFHYGHPPFPKSICTSVNEVICHGIPNDIPLKEGDIMNVDVSCILNGYFGDCSSMVVVGKTTEERELVVTTAKECLTRAIAILKPGVLIKEIGNVICDYAESLGCSVVYQFVGHGIGLSFHEPPQILHSRNEMSIPLAPGMTFTIEPMINAGSPHAVIDPISGWIAKTVDGRASAQWEHTVLITENGHEILTL